MSGNNDRLLRMPEVLERVAFSRSSLYRAFESGRFPSPVKLGQRSVAWRESEVSRWLAERPPVVAAPGVEAA